MGGWVGGWMGGWMDGWIGGWMDGWVDRDLMLNAQSAKEEEVKGRSGI